LCAGAPTGALPPSQGVNLVMGSYAGRGVGVVRALLAGCALTSMLLAVAPARAADDPWAGNQQWASVRVGYAKAGAEFAGDGSIGWGFGYTRFLHNGLAWSANVQHDLLGRFAGAAEIEVPLTVEFTKHLRWSHSTRPYLGMGWGAFYRKTYRTGADEAGFHQGIFAAGGANGMIDKS